MSTSELLSASLSSAVLAQDSDVFYAEDVFDAIAEHEPNLAELTADALPEIQQYLNELVFSGVLWQSGEGYFFRIQQRVAAETIRRFIATTSRLVHA